MSNQELTYSRYPGIRSFEPSEANLFFGRSKETRELSSLVKVERFVVLFSKSGIGKTSLLNAGVLPRLEAEDMVPVKVRFQNSALQTMDLLEKSIRAKIEELGLTQMVQKRLQKYCGNRSPFLWEYLKACELIMNYLPAKPLLVLDQFEEFFMHEKQDQQELIQLLADLIFGRVPREVQQAYSKEVRGTRSLQQWLQPLNWKIILAIRSDRLSLLDNLSDQIPAILDNRYQLYPLNKKQASEAILLPAQSTAYDFQSPAFEYEKQALQDILDNLSNEKEEIESFQLQIICRHLEELVMRKNIRRINPEAVGGREGIRHILNNYYEDRIASLGTENDQLLARKLIEEGLIVDGARVGLAEAIVLKRYSIVPELLRKIEATRIIKPENTHLGKSYEVSHDTLVAPILKSYEQRQVIERQQAQEAERLRLEAKAAEERRKRRRANLLTGVSLVFAVVAIIASVIAIGFSTRLAKQKQKLNTINQDLETQKTALVNKQEELKSKQEELTKEKEKVEKELRMREQVRFESFLRSADETFGFNACPDQFIDSLKTILDRYPNDSVFNKEFEAVMKRYDKSGCKE